MSLEDRAWQKGWELGEGSGGKFLTLDGSEPGKGGRIPSPNLEDVSPPV